MRRSLNLTATIMLYGQTPNSDAHPHLRVIPPQMPEPRKDTPVRGPALTQSVYIFLY